jgi:hypothetical protein
MAQNADVKLKIVLQKSENSIEVKGNDLMRNLTILFYHN